jgi:hypothetical protein
MGSDKKTTLLEGYKITFYHSWDCLYRCGNFMNFSKLKTPQN